MQYMLLFRNRIALEYSNLTVIASLRIGFHYSLEDIDSLLLDNTLLGCPHFLGEVIIF